MAQNGRQICETAEFAAMMRRMVRAHARRCADGDIEDLAELIALRKMLDGQIAYAVREGRRRWDWTWADVARATGKSRQAAYARWGRVAQSGQ